MVNYRSILAWPEIKDSQQNGLRLQKSFHVWHVSFAWMSRYTTWQRLHSVDSKGFYQDLNEFYTAEYCGNKRHKVTGPLYEVERVVSAKTLWGKVGLTQFFMS